MVPSVENGLAKDEGIHDCPKLHQIENYRPLGFVGKLIFCKILERVWKGLAGLEKAGIGTRRWKVGDFFPTETVAWKPTTQPETGFAVLPKRWIVERTFSWFGWYRRLSKDYEELTASSEAMILFAACQGLRIFVVGVR